MAIDSASVDRLLQAGVDNGDVPNVSEAHSKWEAATSTSNVLSGANVIFTAPLLADPGTTSTYGINADWLGKVIEAAGGVGLDVAVKGGITGPLGMNETAFQIADAWKDGGLTPVQAKVEGTWVDSGIELNQSPEYHAGGHGLYSTPNDYIKFEQALLRGGELGGARIMQSDTVDAALTNQIGDLDFPTEIPSADPSASHEFNAGPGWKWGYGLLLNTADLPGMRRAGMNSPQDCVDLRSRLLDPLADPVPPPGRVLVLAAGAGR